MIASPGCVVPAWVYDIAPLLAERDSGLHTERKAVPPKISVEREPIWRMHLHG